MRGILVGLIAVLMAAPAAAQEWGTIAFSPSTHAMGWSYNAVNEVDAELTALNRCAKHADDCITAINFRNACGALAIGENGGWGSAWDVDEDDAQDEAVEKCSEYDDGCEVVRWQCSRR